MPSSLRLRAATLAVITLALAAPPADPRAACATENADTRARLRVEQKDAAFVISGGGSPLLEYRRGDGGYKPYVSRLFTPGGHNVLRDAPPDHTHHHGLMFAIGADDVDFWSERYVQAPGSELETGARPLAPARWDGHAAAGMEQDIEWVNARNGPILRERRRLLASRTYGEHPATIVTWSARLEATSTQPVRLWGRAYFGLGVRFQQSMDGNGHFEAARGATAPEVVQGDERLRRARWCAYVAECEGEPVTLALFDHPANPRHPATWFTMAHPFAYLSATLGLAREPLTLPPGQALDLIYAVAVWDGDVPAERVESLWRTWSTTSATASANGGPRLPERATQPEATPRESRPRDR